MKHCARALVAVLAILLVSAGAASAQYVSNVSKVGTVAAPFLEIGIGARALGMGGAFTAVSNDVSGTYWNPAGLARMEQGEVGFVHTEWLADITFDNIAAVFPLGNGMAAGGFVTTLGMEDMEVRTIEMPEGTGEKFRAGDLAFGLTWAMTLTDRLSVGANGKYIRQQIWNMNASSMAADLGLLFQTPYRGLALGMSVSNFGPDMKMEGENTAFKHDIDPNNPGNNDEIPSHLDTQSWSLPLTFRAGVSMPLLETVNYKMLAAVDAVHPNDNYEYLNAGTELSFRDFVFLRGGWKTLLLDNTEQGLTLGAGLKYRMAGNMVFITDVAYADFGRLENVIRYSLGIRF